jgi:hypothetical protein
MSTKKTIQINPELFKMSKTKKNRSKKEVNLTPIISPNNLKHKLLKRIKEHKTNEIKQASLDYDNKNNNNTSSQNNDNNNDEFSGALSYLSDLSKKQNKPKPKILTKQPNVNHNTTIKHPLVNKNSNTYISIDLPPELQETALSAPTQTQDVININYRTNDDVPYGCLKGGKKMTYRVWQQTRQPTQLDMFDTARPPTPPKKHEHISINSNPNITKPHSLSSELESSETNTSNRSQRLQQIKQKLKQIQDKEKYNQHIALEEIKQIEKKYNNDISTITAPNNVVTASNNNNTVTTSNNAITTSNNVVTASNNNVSFANNKNNNLVLPIELEELDTSNKDLNSNYDISELIKEHDNKIKQNTPKKYFKKTIKRKFTLGKSDKLRKVSVLIKDKQTRKRILNVQQEIKKTNITDIRKYLRQHGLVKTGSTCPPDILRKTFECALLAGEVTNNNTETLLHNFITE